MTTLQNRLKEIRNSKGFTQQEMADFFGITKSRLNNYEQGIREPKLEILELMADKLNYPIDYIVGKTDKINCPICNYTYDPLIERSVNHHNIQHEKAIQHLKEMRETKINYTTTYKNDYFNIINDILNNDDRFKDIVVEYYEMTIDDREHFFDFWELFKKMKN